MQYTDYTHSSSKLREKVLISHTLKKIFRRITIFIKLF